MKKYNLKQMLRKNLKKEMIKVNTETATIILTMNTKKAKELD